MELKFKHFLHDIESRKFDTITTASGSQIIQQTTRNELRKEGLAALKWDLQRLYGDDFDIVETKEGLVIVSENAPGDFTFSWEIKNTIKSIDYDPFIEAGKYEEALAAKVEAKREREAAKLAEKAELERKRRAKLSEVK